jgi:hypothetical protein
LTVRGTLVRLTLVLVLLTVVLVSNRCLSSAAVSHTSAWPSRLEWQVHFCPRQNVGTEPDTAACELAQGLRKFASLDVAGGGPTIHAEHPRDLGDTGHFVARHAEGR